MELVHSFSVPASPERTWSLLTDLHQVGSCFPGATVTEADDEQFSGTVKVKLGPIAMMYSGSGHFVSRDDADHRATIEARGKDKRGNGTAGASVMLNLSPDGTGTKVDVKTDLSITGKPAQFGRGVMQDVSDKLLGRFVVCLESQLEDAGAEPETHDPVAASEVDPLGTEAPETATDPGHAEVDAGAATPGASAGSVASDPQVADEPVSDAAVTPVAAPAPAAAAPRQSTSDGGEDVINLGSAVGPVLMSRYGIPLAVGVAGVLGYLLGRGRSGSGKA
ncbi:MAG: SRPBCC family protein [Ornithinimicrobium sp.]